MKAFTYLVFQVSKEEEFVISLHSSREGAIDQIKYLDEMNPGKAHYWSEMVYTD